MGYIERPVQGNPGRGYGVASAYHRDYESPSERHPLRCGRAMPGMWKVPGAQCMPEQSHPADRSWRAAFHRAQSLLWLPGLYSCLSPGGDCTQWAHCCVPTLLTDSPLYRGKGMRCRPLAWKHRTPARIIHQLCSTAAHPVRLSPLLATQIDPPSAHVPLQIARPPRHKEPAHRDRPHLFSFRPTWAVLPFVVKDGIMRMLSK
jgi:hypothetical protein